jgi:hypothetical protein
VQRVAVAALIVSILLFCLVAGCGPSTPLSEPTKFVPPIAKAEKRTPLEARSLDGGVQGKVIFDGEPPVMEFIERIKDHEDRVSCLKASPAETRKQTWMVDQKTRAVANVVVWFEPPPGKFFQLRDLDKKRVGEFVVIDQPHCAFVPHVAAVFPSYFDGDKHVMTGQKLRIKNSAPFVHSVQWNPTRENDQFSRTIAKDGGTVEVVLNQQKTFLGIGCGIHNWMSANVWIFEHPYYAVTKEDGAFEIRHLPTGVELTFKAWHESDLKPFVERKLTLAPGAQTLIDLAITGRKR